MAPPQINYEVQTGQGSRWTIESVHPTKGAAVKQAEALAAAKKVEAVRVVEEREKGSPKVIFEKAVEKAEKPLTIVPVEDSPVCQTVDDLLSFEARLTCARLLRAFLDEIGLTALELAFDYGRLRQIIRHDTLYPQALHRIGTIQGRKTDSKPADRITILERAVSEIAERARENEDAERFREILDEKGIDAMFAAVASEYAEPKAAAYARAGALANALSRQSDWNGKIAYVCDQLDKGAKGDALAALDEVIAEILDGSEALGDVLGGMADLAAALRALAQLSAGLCTRSGGRHSCLPKLNAAMAKHPLVKTRGILLGRIERSLRGIKMLTRQDSAADRDAFVALLDVLAAPGGLRGGRSMSEAVTARARMTLAGDGEDLMPEVAIAKVQEFFKSRAARLGYLLDLSGTPFGAKYQAAVLKALMTLLNEVKDITALLPQNATAAEQRAVIEDLSPRLNGGGLPPELREQILRKLQRILSGAPASPEPKTAAAPAPAQRTPQTAPPPPPSTAPAPAASQSSSGADLPRKTFAAGEFLFRQGDPGDEAYLIMSGEVEILRNADNGSETLLSTLARGDIFGEMALINHAPRVASARAKGPVAVIVVSAASFQARLDKLAETDRMMRRLLDAYAVRLAAMAGA